jgi:membrane protein
VRGGWYAVGGVVLSFFACWIVLTPMVIWTYRYIAPGRPEWLATVLVGSFTAANLSGFLHGFVLFCSLPLKLGVPFGGFTQIGGMVAVGLWLYLFHTILLAGYAATRSASAFQRARRVQAADPPPQPDAPHESHSERRSEPAAAEPTGSTVPAAASSPGPAVPGPASHPR